ncbi:MAG: hypothetical protein U1E24_08845 [Phenylobacterium sp.]|nr:hypothetical protein [Phenylobacterium sp.]
MFFLSLSVVSLNLYLWVLARAREAAPGRGGIFLSLAIYASVVPSLVAQLYLFELTGFKGVDVPFVDDHNRAVYFWVAGDIWWMGALVSVPQAHPDRARHNSLSIFVFLLPLREKVAGRRPVG